MVDSLPRNAMGKVLKKELATMRLRFDEICIDAHDATALGAWWSKVLGWPHDIDETATSCCMRRRAQVPTGSSSRCPTRRSSRTGSTWISARRPAGRGRAGHRLGARHVDIGQTGDESWVVLADPEGNEFCILAADD